MTLEDVLRIGGYIAAFVAAVVVTRASWQTNSAKVWREEAEAQKARADRLAEDLSEIKRRLARIEEENKRLIRILTSLDPNAFRSLREDA
ncbi:hypothetical protein [Streptomyces sp. URMC 125]|uniref:hypothetical protein n=1 Tax=Streptomyces sp. URMC 125 TaxID=3423419 RepID=UPI003F1BE87D